MITTVIFDFGKVIAMFSHKKICERLAEYSDYSTRELRDIIFKIIYYEDPLEKLFDEGKLTPEEFFQKVKEKAKLKIDYKRFREIWQDIFWLNEPMVKVLEELKSKGYKLVLLSNTNKLHFKWACSQFKILKIFDELILSFKKGYRKPDKRLWRGYGKESVYIDDVQEYCQAAEESGIKKVFHYQVEKHEGFVTALFSFLKKDGSELKKLEMETRVTYIICPDKECNLFWNTKDHRFCDGYCPHQDKMKLIIICHNCGEMIVLPGDHFSYCRIDHPCHGGSGVAPNFRMDNKYHLLYKMPKNKTVR